MFCFGMIDDRNYMGEIMLTLSLLDVESVFKRLSHRKKKELSLIFYIILS